MSHESNYKHYTRGGQISFHNLRMWFQINKALFHVYLFIWAGLSIVLTGIFAPHGMIRQTVSYHAAHFYHLAGVPHVFSIPVKGGMHHKLSSSFSTITIFLLPQIVY